MSAATVEETPVANERYEGLIRTAQELFDAHEESGWRLANVIYDAVMELNTHGLVIADGNNRDRPTAVRQVATDLDRHRLRWTTVHRYYRTWKRFGDPTKRESVLTFGDHLALVERGLRNQPVAVTALRKRRKAMRDGKRPEGASWSDADQTIRAALGRPTQEQMRSIVRTKSFLREVLDHNVWDYPDHHKVVEHIDETQELLDRVKAKPWKTEAPAEDRTSDEPALVEQIRAVLDTHVRWRIDGSYVRCSCGAELDDALAPENALRAHVAAALVAAEPWKTGVTP